MVTKLRLRALEGEPLFTVERALVIDAIPHSGRMRGRGSVETPRDG
jgi:hypothetical protein